MLPEIACADVIANAHEDREAWLAARQDGIGASELATVLGLGGSETELYARKLGLLGEVESSERMRWGTRLERTILEGLAEERNLGERAVIDGRLLRSREFPWMLATLDGWLIAPDGSALLVECKNTAAWEADELPPRIWVQAQAQCLVAGQPRALVASLHRGNTLGQTFVERDWSFLSDAIEAAKLFRGRLLRQEPPPPDGSDATRKALAALYPTDAGTRIDLDDELAQALAERERLRAEVKAAEERIATAENQLRARMGEASLAEGLGWKATYKAQTRKASTCPKCAHEITPASTFRVLRVTAPKGV